MPRRCEDREIRIFVGPREDKKSEYKRYFSPHTWRHLNHPAQRFYKEVVLWSALSHPNIVEFVGVQVDMKKHLFAAASKWMGHRNIMEFIRENHVNRPELVRELTSPPTRSAEMG